MRILYVITASEYGGPSRHVVRLMHHWKKHGHQVGLVSSPEPRLMREAQKVAACIFPNSHFVRRVQFTKDLQSLGPVFHAFKAFKPDLVSAHSTKAGFASRFCSAILGVRPVIFTAHGWSFTEGKNTLAKYVLALAERWGAKFTAKIICVSQYDRELALKFKVAPADQLVMIHNGVDPRPFSTAMSSAVDKKFRKDSAPVITTVGRLVPQKDPLTLLRACLLLKPDFRVLIVGDGALRTQVKQFVNDNRKLYGSVSLLGESENIPEILTASDIFVLSSRWEGLPRAVIEAMIAGLPVVASQVGGVPELVEDGVTGFLVPPGDCQSLAQAIQKLLVGPELRRRMGQAGQEKALCQFSLDRMLAETQKVYEEVLGNPAAC